MVWPSAFQSKASRGGGSETTPWYWKMLALFTGCWTWHKSVPSFWQWGDTVLVSAVCWESPNLFSLMLLSPPMPTNKDPLHVRLQTFCVGFFLSSTAQNFPRILPLLGFGYGSCKVTAVLGGFAARVKAGSRGDVAALYFTLPEVMDAYQHWEWQGTRTACTWKCIAVYCLLSHFYVPNTIS